MAKIYEKDNLYLSGIFILLICTFIPKIEGIKCLDCVGEDCMGSFCNGDYCMIGNYAPRWGTLEWGKPQIVKGCLSGNMVNKKLTDHCEVAEDSDKLFACFCNKKPNCNGGLAQRKLEEQSVPLLQCACKGSHCKSKICLGELCSYVINHKTKKVEQGCVNATVPLIERRTAGSCMMPPITGAMHHTVAKTAEDLLTTESCVCGSDFCNSEKPEITTKETMKCPTSVKAEVMGTKMSSRNVTCTGEYCYKVRIRSTLGHMTYYDTYGCVSYIEGAELAEELNPTGCAKFESENVKVEACFKTNDKKAIQRAKANAEQSYRKGSKGKSGRKPLKMEIEEDFDESSEDNGGEETEENKSDKNRNIKENEEENDNEVEETSKNEEEEKEENKNEGEENEKDEDEESSDDEKKQTTPHYIFERVTKPPPEDDSNITLITVFVLLILLILLSGAVWKLELHKKLMRSSYDTVAGG
uniref:Activin_recp domain-containing protein n=1 Tax=Parastrongyloides trichosuri TaxID=131310 RepID=A0A0N4ZY18_PARTI